MISRGRHPHVHDLSVARKKPKRNAGGIDGTEPWQDAIDQCCVSEGSRTRGYPESRACGVNVTQWTDHNGPYWQLRCCRSRSDGRNDRSRDTHSTRSEYIAFEPNGSG